MKGRKELTPVLPGGGGGSNVGCLLSAVRLLNTNPAHPRPTIPQFATTIHTKARDLSTP